MGGGDEMTLFAAFQLFTGIKLPNRLSVMECNIAFRQRNRNAVENACSLTKILSDTRAPLLVTSSSQSLAGKNEETC